MDFSATWNWHKEQGLDQVWSEEPVPFLDQVTLTKLSLSGQTHMGQETASRDGRALASSSSSSQKPKPREAHNKVELASNLSPELKKLYSEIRAFEECDLKETALNTVISRGNAQAKVMIIGEAPGGEEDRHGKPFIGAAGQLLDKMLSAIGLTEEQVLVSNMVFWRPPGNRKPTPRETELCLPFTHKHIQLTEPKILMLVGGLSAQHLLNTNDGITRLRGRWQPYKLPDGQQIPTMPLLHPAYLLRQPRYKREAWSDLLQVKLKLIELGLK